MLFRSGIPYIRHILSRIEAGEGEAEDIPALRTICRHLWFSYCAFAPGAVSPVEGLLTHFADEVEAHIREKKCPFRGS